MLSFNYLIVIINEKSLRTDNGPINDIVGKQPHSVFILQMQNGGKGEEEKFVFHFKAVEQSEVCGRELVGDIFSVKQPGLQGPSQPNAEQLN
ncbi:unnamed protein product [Leptidea sinapis]|uniref:Uncharacterized protein n=1 Tax=Leptidea sinapis TaxID=189913 RepID=A0A5E4QIW4_9NEOP|nr:unnamed protein product [Leptidea sinapis]